VITHTGRDSRLWCKIKKQTETSCIHSITFTSGYTSWLSLVLLTTCLTKKLFT